MTYGMLCTCLHEAVCTELNVGDVEVEPRQQWRGSSFPGIIYLKCK